MLPWAFPAGAVAFLAGTLASNVNAGWSAALAIAVVTANFVASGLSMAWAAGISPVAIYAVGLGGFVVRLMVFAMVLLILTRFEWFSAATFTAAFEPATL